MRRRGRGWQEWSGRAGANLCGLVLMIGGILAHSSVAAQLSEEEPAQEVVTTGRGRAALAAFDELMTSFIRERRVPGAALAVAYRGRLVYARGFGYADVERKQAVQPDSLFRIASVSKPITAVAILHLAERGKLKLNERILPLLRIEPYLAAGQQMDRRLEDVTIEQLLHHTAGWDRDRSFDPMFRPVEIAKALGVSPPAEPEQVIQYMLGRPLDFAPGERSAYSNFGYCILGRIIERVTGRPYEAYVRQAVLEPMGIRDMRIGRTLPEGRAEREVKYYAKGDGPAVVGREMGRRVPQAYGAWYLEAMDAHGGWIASAPDLVRFAVAFDESAQGRILGADSIARMFARPGGAAGYETEGRPREAYYACGWMVRPVGRSANTWHGGLLPGTSSLLVRRHDGLTWAVLFNASVDDEGRELAGRIDPLLHEAADAVRDWPSDDLFADVPHRRVEAEE